MMLKYLLLVIVLISPINLIAKNKPATSLEDALQIAEQKRLYQEIDWQHLMQYITRTLGNRSSEIQSKDSFFAKDGNKNAQNELRATIQAMYSDVDSYSSKDEHPRCKFIARYYFLSGFINFPEKIANTECPKFKQWVKTDNIKSVSLIFASGYFKNPASFYGHPLLRLNTKRAAGSSSNLLDLTINNGAIVPPNENPIAYMIKGVFGGYDAAFSDTKFYQLNHNYSESDLRDLWDYELDLDDEQLQRVIYYSWELLEQRFSYRFFQRNCGYFLEDLLQYALKKRISPRRKLYTLPATTFFNLVETEIDGRPIVKKISRTPSRHNRLYEKFIALSDHEKEMVKQFIHSSSLNRNQNEQSQVKVIDTLIDYYSFLIAKNEKDKNQQHYINQKTTLYHHRLSLSNTDVKWQENITTTPPHSGSKPTLLRIGAVYNSEFGSGLKLRFRPANYDLIDLDEGHVPNSTLNMFNFEAVSIDGKQRLTRLDLVNIKTLNISRTGLPKDGGLGWGLIVGAEQAENSCLDCLVAQTSGSIIKGKQINDNWTIYGELQATYHSSFEGRNLRTTGLFGAVGKITPYWKSQLLIGQRVYLDGDNQSDSIIEWQNRFGNNPKSNFVLNVNYDGTSQAELSYGYYW